METGIISKSLAAVRREPSETSEMVNQLLFGETFDIVENYKDWYRVIGHFDGYHGWLDSRLTEKISDLSLLEKRSITSRIFNANEINSESAMVHLCPGSILYNLEGSIFSNALKRYSYTDNPFISLPNNMSEAVTALAKSFLNSPYLWGGRSPFGIDCSGLVQVVYRITGIDLPRDASQQALTGSTVEFIDHIKPGDLAFFDNEEGAITHVGIIGANNTIIHSSGFVRIDKFDHQGIFNILTNKYSHKLRVIKRVF